MNDLSRNPPLSPAARSRSRRAYTLIEVMVALMVLGLTIASTIMALRSGFSMIETARDQTMVSQILQSEIETLRLKNWKELSLLPSEQVFVIESDFDTNVASRFRCVRRIRDARAGAQVKIVELQATWRTSNGVERELTYKTRISRMGLNDYYYRSQ
jgi:prepilin-type N-terminal cleavage/methylation domain-containing protein